MSSNATIFKMLDLSTSHITETTCNTWFPTERARNGVEPLPGGRQVFTYTTPVAFYEKGDYGWFVHVDSDWKHSEPDTPLAPGVPVELQRVLEYAAKLGCDWIQFDTDGDVNDDLPVFNWSLNN